MMNYFELLWAYVSTGLESIEARFIHRKWLQSDKYINSHPGIYRTWRYYTRYPYRHISAWWGKVYPAAVAKMFKCVVTRGTYDELEAVNDLTWLAMVVEMYRVRSLLVQQDDLRLLCGKREAEIRKLKLSNAALRGQITKLRAKLCK